MKNRYYIIGLCVLMMSCVQAGAYDDYSKDALVAKMESALSTDNPAKMRDAAESFVARFPLDEQIDVVRLRLLLAYIESNRYKLAAAYADRLLNGVLLDDAYREDVEYYKILMKVEKSKHWMAQMLYLSDIYRNFTELATVVPQADAFIAKYPNSAYVDEIMGFRSEVRVVLANHELGVALHYARKGNMDAASMRLDRYYESYSDIDSPTLEVLLSYPELG